MSTTFIEKIYFISCCTVACARRIVINLFDVMMSAITSRALLIIDGVRLDE
jgi:hypothetical protein